MATEAVGRQNTRALDAGEQAAYQMTGALGGTVFSWDLFNIGPADVWARWDGQDDATVDDNDAVYLPAGTGFNGAVTTRMTVAADTGGTTITFAINDRS